jgi:hypothetical protein
VAEAAAKEEVARVAAEEAAEAAEAEAAEAVKVAAKEEAARSAEAVRVPAEKAEAEAARFVAEEAEAARVVAEAEAARVVAEDEAARVVAEEVEAVRVAAAEAEAEATRVAAAEAAARAAAGTPRMSIDSAGSDLTRNLTSFGAGLSEAPAADADAPTAEDEGALPLRDRVAAALGAGCQDAGPVGGLLAEADAEGFKHPALQSLRDKLDALEEAAEEGHDVVVAALSSAERGTPGPRHGKSRRFSVSVEKGGTEQSLAMMEVATEEDSTVLTLLVVCPPGVAPGDFIYLTALDGQELEVAVPDGVQPGDEFELSLPATDVLLEPGPAALHDDELAVVGGGGGAGGDELEAMAIVCPEGVGPGEALAVMSPRGVEVEVLVPESVRPGEEFEVTVACGEPTAEAAAEVRLVQCCAPTTP